MPAGTAGGYTARCDLELLAAAWDLRRAWRRDPYPALPESDWARAGVAALLVGTWILQAARHI